jgi:uncharacterized protein
MTYQMKRLAIALAAALLAAMLLSGCTTTVVSAPANSSLNTVTSSGSGTYSAAPDQAAMSFGVSASAKDAKSALDQVSVRADKVTAALKAAGVADKDIQTTSVNIYPQYADQSPTSSKQPQIVGYQASLSVTAKVRDLASLSKVIGAATAAGVDTVNGPTFSISDDSSATDKAIQKAVDDARRTASAMAKAAGRSLGPVVSVTDNGSGSSRPVPMAFDSAAKAAGTAAEVPIQPGQLDVVANVTVVFALK